LGGDFKGATTDRSAVDPNLSSEGSSLQFLDISTASRSAGGTLLGEAATISNTKDPEASCSAGGGNLAPEGLKPATRAKVLEFTEVSRSAGGYQPRAVSQDSTASRSAGSSNKNPVVFRSAGGVPLGKASGINIKSFLKNSRGSRSAGCTSSSAVGSVGAAHARPKAAAAAFPSKLESSAAPAASITAARKQASSESARKGFGPVYIGNSISWNLDWTEEQVIDWAAAQGNPLVHCKSGFGSFLSEAEKLRQKHGQDLAAWQRRRFEALKGLASACLSTGAQKAWTDQMDPSIFSLCGHLQGALIREVQQLLKLENPSLPQKLQQGFQVYGEVPASGLWTQVGARSILSASSCGKCAGGQAPW